MSGCNKKSRLLGRLSQLGWFVGYLITMAAIVYGMIALRHKQLSEVTAIRESTNWQEWRHEAERQSTGKGPVQRSIPKSLDPPLRVLFSQNFSMLVVFALIFGSALYFIFYFFVRATLSRQAEIHRDGTA